MTRPKCETVVPQSELGELPDLIAPGAGNGEFTVTKERVLQRPLRFYAHALDAFHVSATWSVLYFVFLCHSGQRQLCVSPAECWTEQTLNPKPFDPF